MLILLLFCVNNRESNPNISDWMIQQGFTSYSEVEEYFCERLIAIAKKHNMKYIIWEDPITHNNVTVCVTCCLISLH